MKSWQSSAILAAAMFGCFALGQWAAAPAADGSAVPGAGAVGLGVRALHAQGRGPTNPPPVDPVQPAPTAPSAPVVVPDDGGQSASANGFLAVTGSYGIGTSVLYLIDTQNRQLAVYEARGGTAGQRSIVLVGARKIDLDLMLEGYNDRSEYDYRKLRGVFENGGSRDKDVSTGLEGGGSTKK